MAYRRWRTGRNWNAEEVISDVNEIPARGEERTAELRSRRVASGMPGPLFLAVVTAIPEGTPNIPGREARAARAAWARERASQDVARRKQRRPVHFQDQDPLPIPQVGERPLIRWRQIIAERDADRRAARIRGTKNELAFNYAWLDAGDTFGVYLEEIQRHMLEPVGDGGRTWYDPFWTRDEVLDWLENRVNRFLLETGARREQEVLPAVEELQLPEMNELRRAIYFDVDGVSTPLDIGDLSAKDNRSPGWGADAAGTPETIILWGQGAKARLAPPPAGGTILLDYVPRWRARLDEGQRGDVYWTAENLATRWPGDLVQLPILNIFYPYIKYGVMADMLSKEGEAQDVNRAKYCQGRYEEGVELAKILLGRKD